jgi:D-3-phosphoglycerate dehydrogenase
VTNCPDTFIEEVADHAMTLIWRAGGGWWCRTRWCKGRMAKARPMLYQFRASWA